MYTLELLLVGWLTSAMLHWSQLSTDHYTIAQIQRDTTIHVHICSILKGEGKTVIKGEDPLPLALCKNKQTVHIHVCIWRINQVLKGYITAANWNVNESSREGHPWADTALCSLAGPSTIGMLLKCIITMPHHHTVPHCVRVLQTQHCTTFLWTSRSSREDDIAMYATHQQTNTSRTLNKHKLPPLNCFCIHGYHDH